MVAYLGNSGHSHLQSPRTGILVTNLGTPDAPTTSAVRRYLREFLSDPRVIEVPRLIWWPILHGIILTFRPPRSAAAYQKIWSEDGSPLLAISQRQVAGLKQRLADRVTGEIEVTLGMRYGKPSIAEALERMRENGVRRVLVLPLYPQYAGSTSGSTFDAVADALKRWRWLPDLHFVHHYHAEPGYIAALAESVREAWRERQPAERLLFSFHGLPRRYLDAGDPYHCECQRTARMLAEALELPEERWQVAFQSRVGREEWLRPYTDQTLMEWGKSGTKNVDVICPGFSADCLETLEEIAMQNTELFVQHGGESLHYIPALNDRDDHLDFLADLVARELGKWAATEPEKEAEAQARRDRAVSMGALR